MEYAVKWKCYSNIITLAIAQQSAAFHESNLEVLCRFSIHTVQYDTRD